MQAQMQEQTASLRYAGVGIRFIAQIIDGIVLGIVGAIIAFATGTTLPLHTATVFGVPMYTSSPIVSGLSVLPLLYFIIMEAAFGGTLGKLVLGLRVVALDGTSISWGQSIVRNLLRVIDILFGYLVGAIFIWSSPLRQRFGDMIARTVVVKK